MGSPPPRWYPLPDDSAAVEQAILAFRTAHGREPDGVWAAPGRVNVIGEHVDYNGGSCLPFALPHKTFVALGLRADQRLNLVSAQDDHAFHGSLDSIAPGTIAGWAGYPAGVAWALRRQGHRLGDHGGFDATVVGCVPLGAGLSSSAALECAVAVALDDLCGLGLAGSDRGRALLAAACVDAENEIAGAPTGGMDQAASLRSAAGHALLLDCTDFSARLVPFDGRPHGLELLVVDTRAHHALVDGQYGSRRQACERAARALGVDTLGMLAVGDLDGVPARLRRLLGDAGQVAEAVRRVRHVVTEIDRVHRVVDLLDRGRLPEAGPLLDASHASLRDDYEVSCAELDVACAAAVSAGALGARMTGGGFGGSAIALVEASAVDVVATAVTKAFSDKGFGPPTFLRAVPSAPAHRAA